MLRPANDRLDYTKMLTPPYGYETVFAVGTTYSLDLDALIGASIALGLSESVDNEMKDNPIYLLEALQRTLDKVLVFCEGGQIKVPNNSNALHIFLEKMVVEVKMKNKRSFHPKFWLIKYTNQEGRAIYRCIVLSRNLTFDRSWDVAVSIDGEIGEDQEVFEKSRPLSDFLGAITRLVYRKDIDRKKRRDLLGLSKEILNVKFKLDDRDFYDFSFMPVGIKGYDRIDNELLSTYHESFIVTPFLSEGIISKLNSLVLTNPNPNTLITRRSELAKLKPSSVSRYNVYVMKEIIIDGEDTLSEGDVDSKTDQKQHQDIHAKIYLKKKHSERVMYLGSLNASNNAFNGNVELLFKLRGKKKVLGIDEIKSDIFGKDEKDNPFEIVEITEKQEPEITERDNLEKIIKSISRLKSYATVKDGEGVYTLEVKFEKIPDYENVFISPLLSNREAQISERIVFENLNIMQLSQFYVLSVHGKEDNIRRLIKIETSNLPQERESSVVNSVIKDKKGFIQYLTFILGEDYLLSFLENGKNNKHSFVFGNGEQMPALYEKMLRAAAHNPGKIREIKRLMGIITDEDIIPEEFRSLYAQIEKAVD